MGTRFTLGVIGVGNMGSALVRGVVGAGVVSPQAVIVADPAPGLADGLAGELGVQVARDNAEVASASEGVVLAVKPWHVEPVLREIEGSLSDDQVVISLATGVTLAEIGKILTRAKPHLVRVMPNTPALVGAGMFALAAPDVPQEKLEGVRRLLEAIGRVVVLDEGMMNAATGLSGSGPAFVFVIIEALADGGVAMGLPRAVALELAAQTVFGAAKLVLETGKHPARAGQKGADAGWPLPVPEVVPPAAKKQSRFRQFPDLDTLIDIAILEDGEGVGGDQKSIVHVFLLGSDAP